MYYRLVGLDMWGNAKDGWTMNDRFPSDVTFDLTPPYHEEGWKRFSKEVVTMLRDAGYLTTNDLRRVGVEAEGFCEYITIYQKKTLKPIYDLELIDNPHEEGMNHED